MTCDDAGTYIFTSPKRDFVAQYFLIFGYLRSAGAELLDAGSSDWVVFAGPNGYPADEAYFLHFIVHTMHAALEGHPDLDAARFEDWVAQRHAQVEQGALVYIAHQLDFLGRVPPLTMKK
jgi:hypothetical protein